MQKLLLDDFRDQYDKFWRRVRSIHRIVMEDPAFAAAYADADTTQAYVVRKWIEEGKNDPLRKWLKDWKESQKKEWENRTVSELRDIARMYSIRDKQFRNANKSTLISIIRQRVTEIEKNHSPRNKKPLIGLVSD